MISIFERQKQMGFLYVLLCEAACTWTWCVAEVGLPVASKVPPSWLAFEHGPTVRMLDDESDDERPLEGHNVPHVLPPRFFLLDEFLLLRPQLLFCSSFGTSLIHR